MSTKSVHAKWADGFDELTAWIEAHGRLPRNTRDASTTERRLSAWITGQRNRHLAGLLPARHTEALRGIDGVLDVQPLTPRQKELKAWVAVQRRRPDVGSADPAEAAFGVLVHSLRSYALRGRLKLGTVELLLSVPDALTEDEAERALSLLSAKLAGRRQKLAELTAAIDPLEAKWSRGFTDLSNWFLEHGSLPSRRAPEAVEYRISNWLNVQRMQHRKDNLLPDYVARLQGIPGALEPRRPLTDVDIANRIAAFHAEHGRLPGWHAVPAAERTSANYLWRLRRKIQDGTVDPDALEAVSSVPGAVAVISIMGSASERLAGRGEEAA